MVISVELAKAQAQLVIKGAERVRLSTFGVAVPVLEAAAAGLEPGGQGGLNQESGFGFCVKNLRSPVGG